MNICPGCGLKSETSCQDLNTELSAYTLSLQDPEFLHQLVVDTYAAQHATLEKKPIYVTFGLVGLYLTYEKGFTGKQVQKAHMSLANKSKTWPKFISQTHEWPLTVADVMEVPEGEQRNVMIKKWGESVWQIWRVNHLQEIESLIKLL
jgi:Family of unknown function (DUF5946)